MFLTTASHVSTSSNATNRPHLQWERLAVEVQQTFVNWLSRGYYK